MALRWLLRSSLRRKLVGTVLVVSLLVLGCVLVAVSSKESIHTPFSFSFFASSPRDQDEDPPRAQPRPWRELPAPAPAPHRNLSGDLSCPSLGIVTPTSSEHFQGAARLVGSFLARAPDYPSFEHTFVVDTDSEVSVLRALLSQVVANSTVGAPLDSFIRIVSLPHMLSELGVDFDETQLSPSARGASAYLGVKRVYGVLYANCTAALMLDSEALAIRDLRLFDLFRGFLESPFLIVSQWRSDEYAAASVHDSLRALGYDETAAMPYWTPLNYNGWFVERHILQHFLATVRFNTGREFLHNFYGLKFPLASAWTSYALHLLMHQDLFPQYHFLEGPSLLHRFIRDPEAAAEVVRGLDTYGKGGAFERPGGVLSAGWRHLGLVRALAEFADGFQYRFSRFDPSLAANRTVALFAVAPSISVLCAAADWTESHQDCLDRFDALQREQRPRPARSPKERWASWLDSKDSLCPAFADTACNPCERQRISKVF